jgi:hypothetical protein
MSNKRKRTTNSENKTKKIDSYFKPVQSEAPVIDSPTFKKVKLKTRTLLRQHSADNQSDHGNDQDAVTINKKKRTDKEEEEEEEEEEDENKVTKAYKENALEEKQAEQEQEGASNEQVDKVESSSQIKATQTQELDTQNVPIFSTQTQTQTDTIIGSPITYTFAEDEEEDCFFDLPKLVDSQIKAKKEQQDEEGLLFSSTQESSLDDFDDIFNHSQDVNIVSLEDDNPAIAETDEIKISSNLPDTNLSFPSSTL